jgi:hypothetical protein
VAAQLIRAHTSSDLATHAGEVPVNLGGEPGRDDSGLPPVDIEIPDDARELDRDVLAYRRERRAQRRRARLARLLGPLRGHGAILPLIASCVALSMLAGALLSVFTISPASAPVLARSAAPVPPAAGARDGGLLPQGTVLVSGKATPLRGLAGAVLALISPGCNCDTTLRQLTAQAARAGAKVFFVGSKAAMVDVTRLARTDSQGTAVAVNDTRDLLRTAYQPAGLTIVLVRADTSTTVHRNLTPGFRLDAELRALSGPAPGALRRPGPLTSAAAGTT